MEPASNFPDDSINIEFYLIHPIYCLSFSRWYSWLTFGISRDRNVNLPAKNCPSTHKKKLQKASTLRSICISIFGRTFYCSPVLPAPLLAINLHLKPTATIRSPDARWPRNGSHTRTRWPRRTDFWLGNNFCDRHTRLSRGIARHSLHLHSKQKETIGQIEMLHRKIINPNRWNKKKNPPSPKIEFSASSLSRDDDYAMREGVRRVSFCTELESKQNNPRAAKTRTQTVTKSSGVPFGILHKFSEASATSRSMVKEEEIC